LVSKINVHKAKLATMVMGELPKKEKNKEKYLEIMAELNSEISHLVYEGGNKN
jgi:hypothetical protein